jgi:hypothetical protein
MSTGAVAAFTPTQPTQSVSPSNTANSLVTFNECDTLMLYNSGNTVIFVALANSLSPYAATPVIVGGMPIPQGAQVVIGVPGVVGSDPVNQIALLSAAAGAGTVYITPGFGTQH